LSKKQQAELVRVHADDINAAFVAAEHTATFSPNHFISNKKVPPIGMLKEAARLFREGKVLNMNASDAESYQRIDRRGARNTEGRCWMVPCWMVTCISKKK
jgi:hypothetical protein